VQSIGENLFEFWTHHQDQLKHALVGRRQRHPMPTKQLKDSITMQMTLKDLVFVLSELSGYLNSPHIVKSKSLS
jgi:hypothetical protein